MAEPMTLTVPIRGDKLAMLVAVKALVHQRKTEFQRIEIVDTEVFGRMLLLDGHVQLAELDEHAYHESLVHVPAMALDHPRRALVVGGGDGGVLRELCRHPFDRIDLVEIDPGVIEACRDHMPFLNNGAFLDPRVALHIGDAFQFVKKTKARYDLIVMDSTDVYEEESGGLSERLFSRTFYEDCREILEDKGIVVTQADNLVFCPYSMDAILADFREVFIRTGHYQALVPSFGGYSGFVWGSKGTQVSLAFPGGKARELGLRYLDAVTYELAFETLSFEREPKT